MIIVTTSSGRHWQSNTETVVPPLLSPAAGGSGGCAGASPAPSGRGDGLAPLPGWILGFGQCQGLLFPPGWGALWGPSVSPSPGAVGLGSVCRW